MFSILPPSIRQATRIENRPGRTAPMGLTFSLCLALLCCLHPAELFAAAHSHAEQEKRLAAELARRDAILTQAVKNAYTPPRAGVIPQDQEMPFSSGWEDPDWDTPLVQSFYKNPYSYGNNLEQYLPCLQEALQGNPKAMLALSMLYYLWGYVITDMYPDFPEQMHNSEYWRKRAAQLTDPGWVNLRLGDLHRRWPTASSEFYRQAAELGNAEAMFNYYLIDSKQLHYLYLSAALGYPRAAFVLGENLEKHGDAEEQDLARRFTWLAALNGDEWGLLRSSIAFYNGEFGPGFNNCEQGYLYALLALRYNQGHPRMEQYPENSCMLNQTQIARLELEADNWQAALDERRLPMVLRGRFRREPIVQAMHRELAPLMEALRLTSADISANMGQNGANPDRRNTEKQTAQARLPWHLGFFTEQANDSYLNYDDMRGNLPLYAHAHYREHNRRYLPAVYAFVAASILLSLGTIYYRHWRKKRRALKA